MHLLGAGVVTVLVAVGRVVLGDSVHVRQHAVPLGLGEASCQAARPAPHRLALGGEQEQQTAGELLGALVIRTLAP
ncbi:hypothetical protein [Streptomyces sp. A5-4]|uniref:hypothetical protein n=1 Tax=Streptomyces sp. A5-4 TaxID=3384771 RepID=UPI003DA94D52